LLESGGRLKDFLSKKKEEQVSKISQAYGGSKISQFVDLARKTSEELTSAGVMKETGNATSAARQADSLDGGSQSNSKFLWTKLGRGALLDRIKQNQSS
jgi:hypothetical protein